MIPNNPMALAAMQAAQWSAMATNAAPPPPQLGGGLPPPALPGTSLGPKAGMAGRVKPAWPPCFDTHGGGYVFQAQSGYFLDPASEFYYCPKSKLYYNSIDGVYFKYAPLADPPFARFDPPEPCLAPSDAGGEGLASTGGAGADEASMAAAALARKPVILSLGGGKAKAKPAPVPKKVMSDLAKWGSLQSAADEEGAASAVSSSAASGVPPDDAGAFRKRSDTWESTQAPPTVAMTKQHLVVDAAPPAASEGDSQGQAQAAVAAVQGHVCLLCRRQFNSTEQLSRHEKESKLHAENVAKQQQQLQQEAAAGDGGYRDRALERRQVHGASVPSSASVARRLARGGEDSDEEGGARGGRKGERDHRREAPLVAPPQHQAPARSVAEDAANPGNQLLRRMGWSEGQGLGRSGTGIEDPIELAQRNDRTAGVGASDASVPPIVYSGEGRDYKESILRAARARFEQISRKET